ncbi:P-loop containing nucleoside triphosphate hydrolase protein [Karstenula rhodostoma CBS 690.94]|uniref:RNA helicase n=1 Tax=Karstenula rhodostoma CBS 690.94 TaxID=1392251 RepID=A0A9P4UIF1_9PLEO|nr:P-loop containing nucleoside triphosphate hydrolase protein [Karstenula rhodostoma CBS 690.94]
MPALPAQRASLCLFCKFAARTRLQPQRLLPRTQVAHRSGAAPGRKPPRFHDVADRRVRASQAQTTRQDLKGKNVFNPVYRDGRPGRGHPDFFQSVRNQMETLRADLAEPSFLQSLHMDRHTFDGEWETFERAVSIWIKQGSPEILSLARGGFRNNKKKALESRLRYLFYAHVYGGRFTKAEKENQKQVADLRYPAEWYPATREIPRTVHLHVGPTNSGKTYHALKRLEEADRGIYLGPLRLLAHEVYTRLNAKGKPCALVTGEEQRVPDGDVKMWSCTVEMAPLNTQLDVAVIDEIQMISHSDRGWAWTSAFLGVQAREIHLCGEARTVPIIKELCALVGDKVEVHEYERLTPLRVADKSLNGSLNKLEKGDCIVAFSVLGLHALRKEVETKTGKKCAIVYGSLPPETRAQQARLFNDPDNDYDFLVASDAIGMGLNLSIKRVIFESTMKNNGSDLVPLKISEVKQIGGRAGRYRSAHQAVTADTIAKSDSAVDPVIGLDDVKGDVVEENAVAIPPTVGFVTTLDRIDFDYLASAMDQEPEPIETVGLFPPALIVERFANYFPPGTPFSYIMLRLHEISVVHPRFHLCALKDQLAIADVIHEVKNLSITDRIMICSAPTNMRDEGEREFLRVLAECIAENKSGELLDLPSLPLHVLDEEPTAERKYLYSLEQLHKMIVMYLWLSYRFPQVFTTRKLANYVKQLTEDAIERTLMQFSWSDVRNKRKERTREAMREMREQQIAAREAEEDARVDLLQ